MLTLLEWLPRIGAILSVLIGLLGFFKPKVFLDQINIDLQSPMAWSEARAVFGGMNLGLGLAALTMDNAAVYTALGVAWGFLTLARLWSLAVDGPGFRATLPALIVDGGLCLLFLSPVLFG
ncbi:MAG: DUF4345 family protein [Pseudomonadota bacterium]